MLGEYIKKGRLILAAILMGRSSSKYVPLRLGGLADAVNDDEAVTLRQLRAATEPTVKPPASGSGSGSGVGAMATVNSATDWTAKSSTPTFNPSVFLFDGAFNNVSFAGVPSTHTLQGVFQITDLGGSWTVEVGGTVLLNGSITVLSMNVNLTTPHDPTADAAGTVTGFVGTLST